VRVDLAVLGRGVTLGGSGDLAILTFRTVSDAYALAFEDAVLRGVKNQDLGADLVVDIEGDGYEPDLPTTFRLVGNVPNPFNPVTRVAYHVPRQAHVRMRVYDVGGRLVRTLVDQVIEPGRHQAVWDGRSDGGNTVATGVYFCKMEAEDYTASHKMLLLK